MFDNLSFTNPVADKLLEIDYQFLTKAERWQLIARLEAKIARYEQWQGAYQPGSELAGFIKHQLQALRLKRFAVWNSFFPSFHQAIRIGAYAG